MVFSNLVHRPLRAMISVFAISIEVTLILLIVGMCLSMLNDNANRQKGIGFDVMVLPPGSSFFTGITGAPVSMKVADKLRAVPHVKTVAPIVTHFITTKSLEILDGVDLNSDSPNDFNKMGRPFRYLAGGPFHGPYEMIVDDLFAEQNHAKVGDHYQVLNQDFRICGIVEHGKGARRYVPIATLQELLGSEGKASSFFVETDKPENAEAVAAAIKRIPGMDQYVARSLAEYASLMTVSNIPFLSSFFNIVIGISVTIGLIVIFQSMYTAVMERTREIGILKSLGASPYYILNVVLRESLALAVGGVLLGLAFTAVASAAINYKFPLHRMVWDSHWVLRAAVLAIVSALLGGLYPALKAAQKDPIEALAYE
jgi:putative ABC transport system permease protein